MDAFGLLLVPSRWLGSVAAKIYSYSRSHYYPHLMSKRWKLYNESFSRYRCSGPSSKTAWMRSSQATVVCFCSETVLYLIDYSVRAPLLCFPPMKKQKIMLVFFVIFCRWKRDRSGNKIAHPVTGKNILQFVAIKRRDCGEWAIPGVRAELWKWKTSPLWQSQEQITDMCMIKLLCKDDLIL